MFDTFLENYGEPKILGFNLQDLNTDESFLRFSSNIESNLTLFQKSSFCHGCPYKRMETIPEGQNLTLKYDTTSYWNFLLTDNSEMEYIKYPGIEPSNCFMEDISMGEFGVYQIDIEDGVCNLETIKKPVFIYAGLIFGIIFYFFLAIFCAMVNSLRKRKTSKPEPPKNGNDVKNPRDKSSRFFTNDQMQKSTPPKDTKVRLKSLDVFRGITISLMILINHGGGRYWFLSHAVWDGLTPADVVFPWFLWIMGVCIPMGLRSQQRKKTPKLKIFLRILERSIKLFVLGLILNSVGGHNQLEMFRIGGVLQRFGFSYLFTSTLMLFAGPSPTRETRTGSFAAVDDILVLLPQWIVYILIVIGHTMFILYMPVPGCPTGYLGPGGLSLFQGGEPSPNCIGGVTRFVDLWVLGDNHMFQHPSPKSVYETASMDPEGILGTVPILFQVFLGIVAGQILLTFKDHKLRQKRWLAWGLGTLVCGLILSSGTMVEGPIPVNKNLWSLSYVLVTSGFAFFFLALCYFLVDYKKWLCGTPFYQAGMNSIFLYVAHFLTYNVFPWRYKYGEMKTHLSLFIEAMWGLTLWVLVALYLHRKGKFYTV